MPDEQGTSGANETGASGTEQAPAEESQKSLNSQAKELPWVQDLMKSKAELDKMKAAQKDQQAAAERQKLEAEGNYKAALEAEQSKYKKLESEHAREIKRLSLKAELADQGLKDKRAVKLFEDDWDQGKQTVEEYVAAIKADKKNADYFADLKQRVPQDPPPAAGNGSVTITEEQAQRWKRSSDPEKRERARLYFRKKHFGKQK